MGDDPPVRTIPGRSVVAQAVTGMPFSAITVDSSPDWNISVMMSQPPTNSPLT